MDEEFLSQGVTESFQLKLLPKFIQLNSYFSLWVEFEDDQIKATFCHKNGMPLEVSLTYCEELLKELNEKCAQGCSYHIYHLELILLAKKSGCFFQQCSNVQEICRKMQKQVVKMEPMLIKLLTTFRCIYGNFSAEEEINFLAKQQYLKLEILSLISTATVNQNQQQSQITKSLISTEQTPMEIESEEEMIKSGCYYEVLKIKSKFQGKTKLIAKKRLKKVLKIQSRISQKKSSRELQIIQKISPSPYFLNYFQSKDPQSFYMDYVEQTLSRVLRKSLDKTVRMNLIKQVMESTYELHRNGIVHRDLKPSNFLVTKQQNLYTLKLVDFGESVHVKEQFSPQNMTLLGCTVPYSPSECTNTSNPAGFNSFSIDCWSIGVLIQEILLQKFLFTYSQPLSLEIGQEWPTQFIIPIGKRTKKYFLLAQDGFIALSWLFLKGNPKKRLSLNAGLQFMSKIQDYLQSMKQLLIL